jgi:hypothetical protein
MHLLGKLISTGTRIHYVAVVTRADELWHLKQGAKEQVYMVYSVHV